MSRDSSVGTATDYGLNDRMIGVWIPAGLGIFLFDAGSRPTLRPTQPPIQWVPMALFLVVKRPGREADTSPPSSAEVKNAWSYTSTPLYVFVTWCLVKHRGNFTFTFLCKGNFCNHLIQNRLPVSDGQMAAQELLTLSPISFCVLIRIGPS
jgi:hypothetical protein